MPTAASEVAKWKHVAQLVANKVGPVLMFCGWSWVAGEAMHDALRRRHTSYRTWVPLITERPVLSVRDLSTLARFFIIRLLDPTRMWANAQLDGRPAEYTWHPLFNAAKFGWRPLLECHAVTLPRREIRWNLQGCPKLLNRSQPLVGRSSSYYEHMWRRYRCLTSFFSDCRYMP